MGRGDDNDFGFGAAMNSNFGGGIGGDGGFVDGDNAGGGFGVGVDDFDGFHQKTKKEKKSRKKKQDENYDGHEANNAGFGGGLGGGGFDDRGGGQPPSAISEALGQAARPNEADGFDRNYTDDSRYPAVPRRGELGFGDDFRNRDQGFDDPVERRDFGFGAGDPRSTYLGGEPVRRGFSFSMNDMPPETPQSHDRPGHASSSRPHQRWNPFDGLRRNWEETKKEAEVVHIHPAHKEDAGYFLGQHPALPSSAWPAGYPGGAPGTLEHELFRTDERVAALKTKLNRLQEDMVAGSPSTMAGYTRIVVTHLVDGDHLGLQMRDCIVSEIVDQQARAFGWMVGDRVLKVNGYPVSNEQEFAKEVPKAKDAYKQNGKPVVFDIYREPLGGVWHSGTPAGSFKGPPSLGNGGSLPGAMGASRPGVPMSNSHPRFQQVQSSPGMQAYSDPNLQQVVEENQRLRRQLGLSGQTIGQSMDLGKASFYGGMPTQTSMNSMGQPVSMNSMGQPVSMNSMGQPPGSGGQVAQKTKRRNKVC